MVKPSWTIRNIYMYLVCFATLMMMIIGSVQAFNSVYSLVYPAPVSNEMMYKELTAPQVGTVSLEEQQKIEERAKANQEFQEKNNRYYQTKNLFESCVMILIALPVYLYHWRLVRRNDEEENRIRD